jgi:thymidylate synthase ThyX
MMNAGGMNEMNTEHKVDLTRYVSNLDRNVYTIFNLPEEVIAVIFAYVSRSSLSFRDNLAKLLADDELAVNEQSGGLATSYSEKAARFHEKWVVGYGHSSVAEHAVAHIGIEKISRLASAELELANSFNSFTEYSQRYQRPARGDIYIPEELEQQPELKADYLALQDKAYDTYEALMAGLIPYLKQAIPQNEGESPRAYQSRVEKIAFEDARYVLTLATLTNLGMTGNGRALRDTLVALLTSEQAESRQLARDMEREISQVIPTLLKYVEPNAYVAEARRKLSNRFSTIQPTSQTIKGPHARFTRLPEYRDALILLATQMLVTYGGLSYDAAQTHAKTLPLVELEQLAQDALSDLRFFDNPLPELQHLHYQMELAISEANWHQLLRHNRRAHFSFGQPTVRLGYTTPPHVEAAGLAERYQSFIDEAEAVVQKLADWNPSIAQYAVTNAHHRQVTMTASLWELYHLINLRTSPEAQWDIRDTFQQLHEQLQAAQPALARYAKRRLG